MKPKHPVQIEIETKIRSQHKEQSTADAYWGWVKRYFDFCTKNKLGKDVKAEDAVTIQVCRSKHGKTRTVKFPEVLHDHVQRQIDSMRVLHAADKADGLNGVSLPDAYGRKCPSARMGLEWLYISFNS